MKLLHKIKARSKKYLAWIRTRPCAVSSAQIGVEAAHVRWGSNAGTGQKPSDYWALPLHSEQHAIQHSIGEKSFWAKQCVSPHYLIISHLTEYILENDVREEYAVIEALENYIADNLNGKNSK